MHGYNRRTLAKEQTIMKVRVILRHDELLEICVAASYTSFLV
jgi:hypothetical protein